MGSSGAVWARFVILLFAASLLAASSTGTFAEAPHEEYKQVQKDLRDHRKKLESVKKVEKSVLEELNKTAVELKQANDHLSDQRARIKALKVAIAALQQETSNVEGEAKRQRRNLETRLRVLDRMSREGDALLVLMSGEDTGQILRMTRYLKDIAAQDHRIIMRFKDTMDILAVKQSNQKKLLARLEIEERKLAELEGSLREKKKEREVLLASVRKEKSAYERMIAELREASKRLSRIIEESEKKERDLKKRRDGRTVPPAEEPQEDSGFARLRGGLNWPVHGTVAIQYGTQVDPLFNLPVFRSGIHIKAADGASVRAVHEGKIVFADSFKGYGQLIIVNHGGGYHTLYGHLSRIFPKNGAIIKVNQPLGEVGESAVLGTAGLYFEIRYKGKPLDPQQWLKR